MFLIDLKRDPVDDQSPELEVPDLLRRVRKLEPDKIIVIKASVYDLVGYARLGWAERGTPRILSLIG